MKTLLLIIFLTSSILAQDSEKPRHRGPPSQEQRENFKKGDNKSQNFRNRRGNDCPQCKEFRKHLQEKHPRNKLEEK